jgi:hypothetical protein
LAAPDREINREVMVKPGCAGLDIPITRMERATPVQAIADRGTHD